MTDKARNGIGVDRTGGPVVDPTENVISLVQANKERADDLRKADRKLAKAEMKGVRREAKLRTWHNKEMRKLESGRLDAIRNVDVAARITDQKTALDAIQALAAQTQSNRDSLSKLVTDTAQTLATQQAEANKQQLDRIAALEKSSYTGAGKEAVTSPALEELIREVRGLRTGRATDSAKVEGADNLWKVISGVLGLLIVAGMLAVAILK